MDLDANDYFTRIERLTLGGVYAQQLATAVERGFITEAERQRWIDHPPLGKEEYDHRKFILRLINEEG